MDKRSSFLDLSTSFGRPKTHIRAHIGAHIAAVGKKLANKFFLSMSCLRSLENIDEQKRRARINLLEAAESRRRVELEKRKQDRTCESHSHFSYG
jgi:hypothetical protein